MRHEDPVLDKITNNAIKLLKGGCYGVEPLSFCLLAARELEYRFIILICAGMDWEETRERVVKLEQWPLPGRPPWTHGIKEIWIPQANHKLFDFFMFENGEWADKDSHPFSIDKIQDWFTHKSKIQPKMARGHIDTVGGYVYFLYAPNNKAVKIGKTTNLKRRLISFRVALPNAKLLGTIETQTPYELESDLHARFKEYRINGEWFQYQGKLKEYINKRAECLNLP